MGGKSPHGHLLTIIKTLENVACGDSISLANSKAWLKETGLQRVEYVPCKVHAYGCGLNICNKIEHPFSSSSDYKVKCV